MAVLIDPPLWPAHGRRWSHLVSDSSLRELHAFAASVGLPERAFEGDHYDVPEERYPQAVAAGAIPVSGRELLRRLRASGLRRSKRRGERVVASRQDLASGHRIDSVLSALAPLGPVHRIHAVILSAGHLLVLDDGEGFTLPAVELRAPQESDPAGRDLAAALLGRSWAALPVRQVGYLRRVPDGSVLPTAFEVVLRWPDVGPPPPGPVPGPIERPAVPVPLRWVPGRRASALLPAELAPVAMAEHHRLRPDRPEDPATLPSR